MPAGAPLCRFLPPRYGCPARVFQSRLNERGPLVSRGARFSELLLFTFRLQNIIRPGFVFFIDLFGQFFLKHNPFIFPFTLNSAHEPAPTFPTSEVRIKSPVAKFPVAHSFQVPIAAVQTKLQFTPGNQRAVDIADVITFKGNAIIEILVYQLYLVGKRVLIQFNKNPRRQNAGRRAPDGDRPPLPR